MPEMLKFNEDLGSMDAHIAVLTKKILEAQDNLERAEGRKLGDGALQSARTELERRMEEFEEFKKENNIEDGNEYVN